MAGTFQNSVLTAAGLLLNAKVQTGLCGAIELTKAQAGDGSYTAEDDLESLTALKSPKQTFPIDAVSVRDTNNVFVTFQITNHRESGDLETGYYVKEIGIFADDPDEGEILYAVAVGTADQWDYMPAYDALLPTVITIDFLTTAANAESVTIEVPNRQYVYDISTGTRYVFGVENGQVFFEEAEEEV